MGIIISFIILKNGIQVFPYNGKEIIVFYESPYFFKIDGNEEFDLGITYKKFRDFKEFECSNDLNVKFYFKIEKSDFDIVNLVKGYYLPETLNYTSIKIFIPKKDIEKYIKKLECIDFKGLNFFYDINIKPVAGIFYDGSNPDEYINIPPDVNSYDYVKFRVLMKIIERRGFKVKYSRFGKRLPFFIKLNGHKIEDVFKDIKDEEINVGEKEFMKEYMKMKKDEVLSNLFLSISGIDRWKFLEEWEDIIKSIKTEEIESFIQIYKSSGIIWGQS